MAAPRITHYEKYRLSRLLCVSEIVSADYVQGALYPAIHAHQDAWEMGCCLTGRATVYFGKRTVSLKAGELFFVPPGIDHAFMLSEDKEKSTAFVVSFTCVDEAMKLLRNSTFTIDQEQKKLLERTIQELTQAFSRKVPGLRIYHFEPAPEAPLGAEQMICCYLEQLFISLLRNLTMRKGNVITGVHFEKAIDNYQVDAVCRHIREHLKEDLTVEQLAREFHYSRTRLSVLFKKATGQGINEYISRARISLAMQLLSEGKMTVAQVAEAVGYNSPQYFSRRFAQVTGNPPSTYLVKE